MKNISILFLLLITPLKGVSQGEGVGNLLMPVPDLPDPIQSGKPLGPDVRIIQKDNRVLEEYRANGKLYMVKVSPAIGPAYYLVDEDGDGKLELGTNKSSGDAVLPKWLLFSW